MFLLDTNVLSEALKTLPNRAVVRWLNIHFSESSVSTISIFELFVGVANLPRGQRRDVLQQSVERMIQRLGDRAYSFDQSSARAAARLKELGRVSGRGMHRLPEGATDLQIGGTAVAYGLTLATRNTRDFAPFRIDLVNPWESE